MAPQYLRKEKGVAKSHQIQAFRVVFVHYTYSTDCGSFGSYAHAHGAGHFSALSIWCPLPHFRLVAVYYGGRDVNANHRF